VRIAPSTKRPSATPLAVVEELKFAELKLRRLEPGRLGRPYGLQLCVNADLDTSLSFLHLEILLRLMRTPGSVLRFEDLYPNRFDKEHSPDNIKRIVAQCMHLIRNLLDDYGINAMVTGAKEVGYALCAYKRPPT